MNNDIHDIIDKIQLGDDIYQIQDNCSGYVKENTNALINYPLTSSFAPVAFSGDYRQLSYKPILPTINNTITNIQPSNLLVEIIRGNNDTTNFTFQSFGPQLVNPTLSIDLSPYAKKADMPAANDSTLGCFKTSATYGVGLSSGALICQVVTYENYDNKADGCFIGKRTLENVITGKKMLTANNLSTFLVAGNDNVHLSTSPVSGVTTITTDNTTYEVLPAVNEGENESLVTTGEKYIWNNKSNFDGNYNSLTNKPELFSGNYSDLTNKPTNLSDFTNDSNFITTNDIISYLMSSAISGYDASATQTLKNVNGTLTWVTDTI